MAFVQNLVTLSTMEREAPVHALIRRFSTCWCTDYQNHFRDLRSLSLYLLSRSLNVWVFGVEIDCGSEIFHPGIATLHFQNSSLIIKGSSGPDIWPKCGASDQNMGQRQATTSDQNTGLGRGTFSRLGCWPYPTGFLYIYYLKFWTESRANLIEHR